MVLEAVLLLPLKYSPPSGVFRTAVVACMQGEDIYSAGTKWTTTKGANKNNSGWLSGAGRFALPP